MRLWEKLLGLVASAAAVCLAWAVIFTVLVRILEAGVHVSMRIP